MSDPDAVRGERPRSAVRCPRSEGDAGELALDRRTVLSGACLLAVASAVSACGDRDGPSAPAPGTTVGSPADVPVGSGTVFREHRVVVAQPTQGTFHAFSAVCTHQGCTVGQVADGTINCPCHGSRFDLTDGSVVRGPADQPLLQVDITVQGGSISLV